MLRSSVSRGLDNCLMARLATLIAASTMLGNGFGRVLMDSRTKP